MYTTSWHSRYNLDSRLKAKFKRKLVNLQKKNPKINPYTLTTKALAINWWAKAWNANLKNYTFNNVRLEKGKLNLRCGALADLQIKSGQVKAIILGSKIEPYNVKITFEPIPEANWLKIQKLYDGHLESFEKILENNFPKNMSDIYTSKPLGLFPSKKQISFNCDCSTRVNICKHTAVALYTLGAMIDNDIQLLFKLRGVSAIDLISRSIHAERKSILKKARTKSASALNDTDLSNIFKIEIHHK